MEQYINVIGGGLAGTEAAYQIAKKGIKVKLYEMKPQKHTPAHNSNDLAEIVCSNSLKSNLITNACGLLKEELRKLDSLLIKIADETKVPAGQALAVFKKSNRTNKKQPINRNNNSRNRKRHINKRPIKRSNNNNSNRTTNIRTTSKRNTRNNRTRQILFLWRSSTNSNKRKHRLQHSILWRQIHTRKKERRNNGRMAKKNKRNKQK